MFAISRGRVPEYGDDTTSLVYLGTTIERMVQLEVPLVFTDRNAVLQTARYSNDLADLDTIIDWTLMEARIGRDTDDEPDRRERRMAECLVHRRVPWDAFQYVGAYSQALAREVKATLARSCRGVPVGVEHDWYFT